MGYGETEAGHVRGSREAEKGTKVLDRVLKLIVGQKLQGSVHPLGSIQRYQAPNRWMHIHTSLKHAWDMAHHVAGLVQQFFPGRGQ